VKRILTILFFLASLVASSFATVVTVSSYDVSTTWTFGGSTAQMRIYATKTFVTSTSTTVVGGTTSGFYKTITCTIASTTVTCPSFTIDSTTDSSVPTVKYVADLYSNVGGELKLRARFLEPFSVPTSFGTTVTWVQLRAYNTAPSPILPNSYYTTDQVNALIVSGGGGSVTSLANTYNNSLSSAIAAIGATPTTLLVDADSTVSTGLTIPSTLKIASSNNAKISFTGAGSIVFADQGSTDLTANKPMFSITSAPARVQWAQWMVNTTTDVVCCGGSPHGYTNGQRIFLTLEPGDTTVPGGLTVGQAYYAIVVDSTTLKLATSYANALAGIAVDITSAPSSMVAYFAPAPIGWTGSSTSPTQISTEIIDTGNDSLTDRLWYLDEAFGGRPVTFIAYPRTINGWVRLQDRHSIYFTSGDYLHTFAQITGVAYPITMGSYSRFWSDGSAKVYTSTATENNCDVVTTKLNSSHVDIDHVYFANGGGVDLGGNQTVASLFECSHCSIRYNTFDSTFAYAAGIVGNRQNFTDPYPQDSSIDHNTALGYGTQVFYIISGKFCKINNNTIWLDAVTGGGQWAGIDVEPNTEFDVLSDIEVAYNELHLINQNIVNRGIEIQSTNIPGGMRRARVHHNKITGDVEGESLPSQTTVGIELDGGTDIDVTDNECAGNMFGCIAVEYARNINILRNHSHPVTSGAAYLQTYYSAGVRASDNTFDEVSTLSTHAGAAVENAEWQIPFVSTDGNTLDCHYTSECRAYDYYVGLRIWFNESYHTITAVTDSTTDAVFAHITVSPGFGHAYSVTNYTVNAATDTVTAAANHNLASGDAILTFCPTSCPGGIGNGNHFYVNVTGATTFKLTNTHADALAGTNIVDLTSAGSGILNYQPFFETRFTDVLYSNNYFSKGEDIAGGGYQLLTTGTSQIVSTSTDRKITSVADADYSAVQNTGIIVYTSLTTGRTVTLPDPASIRGKEFIVKDGTCSAGSHAISVATAAGNIDGASTFSLETDCGMARFKSDGTNYLTVP